MSSKILGFLIRPRFSPNTLLISLLMAKVSLSLSRLSDNSGLGVATMLLSILLFSMMDVMVKWLGGNYPTHQIMFFRCLVAMIPVSVIIVSRGGIVVLKTQQPLLHLLRSVLGILSMACAFYAFSLMRLADAISILHTAPLIMTALSIFLLREKVGRHRWSAIIAGFIGMLIVIRPGADMLESGSLFMLAAALMIGFNSIIIRHLTASDDPVCITFYFTMTGVLVSSVSIPLFGWVMPSGSDWIFLIAVGLFGGVAQYLMTVSYRHSELAVVAPLKFLSIAIGGLIAYFVWAEVPDLQSLSGISIIVVAGLYAMHRELLLAKRAAR